MRSTPLFPLRLAGYGLLLIGLVNLLLQARFSADSLGSPVGRLGLAHGLAGFAPWLLLSLALIFVQGNRQRRAGESLPLTLLQRLLLPLVLGYLLLIPLMVRDAIAFQRGVQGQIENRVALYRSGSRQLQERVRPLGSAPEVVRLLQRYPNITLVADPADSAATLRSKLSEALSVGEAQLRGRLETLQRNRSEGLAVRTLQSALICLVTATGLAALRLQNLTQVQRSGHRLGLYFSQDPLPLEPRRGRRRLQRSGATFPHAWLGVELEESESGGTARRS